MKAIVRHVRAGKALPDIAKMKGMPTLRTIERWLSGESPAELDFRHRYQEATTRPQEGSRPASRTLPEQDFDYSEESENIFANLGKPYEFSSGIARTILERISSGESLTKICRDPAMPSYDRVRSWLSDKRFRYHAEFSQAFANARSLWLDYIVEDTIDIADDAARRSRKDPKSRIEGARLRIMTRKMVAEKFDPERYSETQRVKFKDEGTPEPVSSETRQAIRDIVMSPDALRSARDLEMLKLKGEIATGLVKAKKFRDIDVEKT